MPESAVGPLNTLPEDNQESHLRLVEDTAPPQLTGLDAVAALAKGLNKIEVDGLSSDDPNTNGKKPKVADRR